MRWSWLLLGALLACDDDEPVDLPTDASTVDASRSLDASADASPLDATTRPPREDAAETDAGLASCPLDQIYKFGWTGGFINYTDEYEVQVGGALKVVRTYVGRAPDAGARQECRLRLPECADALKVDATDLAAVLTDSALSPLWGSSPNFFGADPRIWDGSALRVERADGKLIEIGVDCSTAGTPTCRPLTPALEAVKQVLGQLTQEYSTACWDL